jgi:tetratricopeptide (TPR) repeat protein
VGKTQAAVEYAYRQHADYDLVWWVRGGQLTSLLGDYAALADQLPHAADLKLAEDMPQTAVVAAIRVWLERNRRWLLVFDNVEKLSAVDELLPRSATGHVLLTSQAETGWEPLADPLPVRVLAPTDAAEFLLARTKESGPQADAAAITLASSLGGLPLALEQAAAYVAAAGTVGLSPYAELFATRALELLKRGQPLGYQHTVATTWSLALQSLQKTEPVAVGLLNLVAFLGPDDLPQPLVAANAHRLPEPLSPAAGDPLALADAIAALRRYSLVRVIGDGLFVHRLLQTVVRANLDTCSERAWAVAAIQLLRADFPDLSTKVSTWTECQRLLPHALAVANHGQDLDVEREACLWLLNKAAMYLWSRGQYRQAHTLIEQALAGRRRLLGDDHPDTLQSTNNLALTRRSVGDPQGALQAHEQALAGRRRVLGDDHPDTLGSINDLAETLRILGNPKGALQLFEQALAVRRQVMGDDHPDTLHSTNNLALTREALGDLEGARQLHEQTLAGRRQILGDDDPSTLTSMNNLAETRRALGDLDGARQLHEETLTARRRVLGDDHPNTLASMNNLAAVRREIEAQP